MLPSPLTARRVITIRSINTEHSHEYNECWSSAAGGCNISATYRRANMLPTNRTYNCNEQWYSVAAKTTKHCHNPSEVAVNGCLAQLNITTLNTAYLEQPECIHSLSIEQYPATKIAATNFGQFQMLASLSLCHGRLSTIIPTDFAGITETLQQLAIVNNSVVQLADDAFASLQNLQNLTIKEPLLNIRETIQFRAAVTSIEFVANSVEWPLFPETLIDLTIRNSPIRMRNATTVRFEQMFQLRTLQLTNCNLTDFPIILSSTLELLNLSGNQIETMRSHDAIKLLTFDVSHNKLREIPVKMLRDMPRIRHLCAAHNHIEFVAAEAFEWTPLLETVDISENWLSRMAVTIPEALVTNLHIDVNSNPWNCEWLETVVRETIFGTFVYRIQQDGKGPNVMGLPCSNVDNKNISTTAAPPPTSTTPSPPQPVPPAMQSSRTTIVIVVLSISLALVFVVLVIFYVQHRRTIRPSYRTLMFNSRQRTQPAPHQSRNVLSRIISMPLRRCRYRYDDDEEEVNPSGNSSPDNDFPPAIIGGASPPPADYQATAHI